MKIPENPANHWCRMDVSDSVSDLTSPYFTRPPPRHQQLLQAQQQQREEEVTFVGDGEDDTLPFITSPPHRGARQTPPRPPRPTPPSQQHPTSELDTIDDFLSGYRSPTTTDVSSSFCHEQQHRPPPTQEEVEAGYFGDCSSRVQTTFATEEQKDTAEELTSSRNSLANTVISSSSITSTQESSSFSQFNVEDFRHSK